MKGTLLSTLVLVALSVTLIYAANIDNYAENSGFASTNYFCTCLVQNSTCYIGTAGSNVAIGGHRAQILTPFQNAQGVPWQAGCAASQDDYPSYCASGLAAQTGCPVTGCTGQYGTGGQLSLSTPPRSVSTLLQVWDGGCPTSMATRPFQIITLLIFCLITCIPLNQMHRNNPDSSTQTKWLVYHKTQHRSSL